LAVSLGTGGIRIETTPAALQMSPIGIASEATGTSTTFVPNLELLQGAPTKITEIPYTLQ